MGSSFSSVPACCWERFKGNDIEASAACGPLVKVSDVISSTPSDASTACGSPDKSSSDDDAGTSNGAVTGHADNDGMVAGAPFVALASSNVGGGEREGCARLSERRLGGATVVPLSVGVATDRGGCQYNEDVTGSGRGIYAVYDGHGGLGAAAFCAETLPERILSSAHWLHDVNAALHDGFRQTEKELLAWLRNQQQGQLCCGTTALVLLVRDARLHTAWLGDCRAVLCRGGAAVALTRDHCLADESEAARVRSQGGMVEAGRLGGFLEVARAFGDLDPVTGFKPLGLSSVPEIHTERVCSEDEFIILGSDGLWQAVSNEEAVQLAREELRAYGDSTMASEKLVSTAIQRKVTDDNVTALLVCLRPPQEDNVAARRPRLALKKRSAPS